MQSGKSQCQTLVYHKTDFNKAASKQQLPLSCRRHINSQKHVNPMYETFLNIFLETYERNFPCEQGTVQPKNLKSLRMSKALRKYFIRKENCMPII